jgi:hypothetical protein
MHRYGLTPTVPWNEKFHVSYTAMARLAALTLPETPLLIHSSSDMT